jgi:hypothetical protein
MMHRALTNCLCIWLELPSGLLCLPEGLLDCGSSRMSKGNNSLRNWSIIPVDPVVGSEWVSQTRRLNKNVSMRSFEGQRFKINIICAYSETSHCTCIRRCGLFGFQSSGMQFNPMSEP